MSAACGKNDKSSTSCLILNAILWPLYYCSLAARDCNHLRGATGMYVGMQNELAYISRLFNSCVSIPDLRLLGQFKDFVTSITDNLAFPRLKHLHRSSVRGAPTTSSPHPSLWTLSSTTQIGKELTSDPQPPRRARAERNKCPVSNVAAVEVSSEAEQWPPSS